MSPLRFSPGDICLALDIGGTKVDAALVRPDGTFVRRERIATATSGGRLFDEIVALLHRVDPERTAATLGVGCGGPMSAHAATVSPLNIPVWREFDLRGALSESMKMPVRLDNDAKVLALAEALFGAGRGQDSFLSMVVSTGVGGGIVLDGRLLDGATGNAGHVGHVIVEPLGRRCGCGARGCLEAEASGRAIEAITQSPAPSAPVAMRARTGALVGRAVATVANLLDLRHVYVAGSVALGFGEPFFAAANESASSYARISHAQGLRVEPSPLGSDGPLLGAAALTWWDQS